MPLRVRYSVPLRESSRARGALAGTRWRVRSPGLSQSELPKIDEEFEAIIPQLRGEELTPKENGAAWGCCNIEGAKRSPKGTGVEAGERIKPHASQTTGGGLSLAIVRNRR